MRKTTPATQVTPQLPGGFTMIELLVSIAIIAILVGVLLPVLSTARSTASKSSCQFTLRGDTAAIFNYANDNQQIQPPINPMDGDDTTLTDMTNSNSYLASNGIWGCRTPSWTAGYATAVNQALGVGSLVQGNYINIDNLWCPTTRSDSYLQLHRSDYNLGGTNYQSTTIPPFIPTNQLPQSISLFPSWKRRNFFGEALQKPWPNKDGQPWTFPNASPVDNNIALQCTYSYRSGDITSYSYSSNTESIAATPPGRGFLMLKISRPGFQKQSIMMDYMDGNHIDMSGVNVSFGDGSVTFWSEPNMWKYFTDFRGAARGGYWGNMPNATLGVPVDTAAFGANTNDGAFYQSWTFGAADARLR